MAGRTHSSGADRLALVALIEQDGLSQAQAARRLGYGPDWARKWWRRYRRGGAAALTPSHRAPPGPLARWHPPLAAAVLAHRRAYPHLGARRALLRLAQDPACTGQPLPSARTLHRAWVHAGLVPRRLPRDQPPAPPPVPWGDAHALWEIDHQDHLRCPGLPSLLVLQSIRAPAAGLTIGADLFLGPRGAHGVPEDALFDALRRRWAQWGCPAALSVDGSLRFLGQPQRQFPSRLELLCAGLHIAVVPIRPGRPTDHAAVERLHRTLDGFLLDRPETVLAALQAALEQHLADLNERFPSRAHACQGRPPLVAHPTARHSGRPYDPQREWADFDLAAVDQVLAGWRWQRLVGLHTGQISFADRAVGVGKAWAGQVVQLRFDPADRQVVIYAPSPQPATLGPEIKRFACVAFTSAHILGSSVVASRPTPVQSAVTPAASGGVRPYDT